MEKNVQPVDFGKEQREAARKLGRLLNLVEQQEANIIADPVKYWRMAGEEISRLRLVLEEAHDALRSPVDLWREPEPVYRPTETVTVVKSEHERLRACAAIVERWRR
jgi:hypothetical protein